MNLEQVCAGPDGTSLFSVFSGVFDLFFVTVDVIGDCGLLNVRLPATFSL